MPSVPGIKQKQAFKKEQPLGLTHGLHRIWFTSEIYIYTCISVNEHLIQYHLFMHRW